jgi:hypothetical protein
MQIYTSSLEFHGNLTYLFLFISYVVCWFSLANSSRFIFYIHGSSDGEAQRNFFKQSTFWTSKMCVVQQTLYYSALCILTISRLIIETFLQVLEYLSNPEDMVRHNEREQVSLYVSTVLENFP